MAFNTNCKVLILAAGAGTRLAPLTYDRPKCLVDIGSQPILYYQLSAIAKSGNYDITIVIGYRGEMIQEYIANNFPNMNIKFIYNPDYEKTGKLYSWTLAKKSVTGGKCVILDSDILFHPKIFLLASTSSDAFGTTCFHRNTNKGAETKVVIDDAGRVLNIGKNLRSSDVSGAFAGIYVFSESFSETFFSVAEKMLRSDGPNLFGFDVIRKIKNEQNLTLHGLDVSQYPFAEIDFQEDIQVAKIKVLPHIISALALK